MINVKNTSCDLLQQLYVWTQLVSVVCMLLVDGPCLIDLVPSRILYTNIMEVKTKQVNIMELTTKQPNDYSRRFSTGNGTSPTLQG